MLNYDTTEIEKRCRQLKEDLGNLLTWKWEERLETVLAEFNVKDAPKIRQILQACMGITWDNTNKATAPGVVRIVIDYFGGIQPQQLLFTSDPDTDGLLLCAWWPWGNGRKISVRLAVFADSLSDDDNGELTQIFRTWFRV